jgi:hypothetical protein
VLLAAWLLTLAAGGQNPQGKLEEFAAVDPYTRGAPEALQRAGYVSLGPFPWTADAGTAEIEKALGERRILWVETAHFKLGSTLASYHTGVDKLEDKKLRAELERLGKKLAHFDPERNRLDPWLRLHLFAQRLEDEYAEFLQRFGFSEREFELPRELAGPGAPDFGPGPYLGMQQKPTVLLCESRSTLARFVGEFGHEQESCNWRGALKGGTMCLAQSPEYLRSLGFELDSALHCAVAADLACNLLEGFRGQHDMTPVWFECGLATWFSRRIDERWSIYVRGTTFRFDDDSWKWAPRVRALVSHDLALPWSKMLDWKKWDELDGQANMVLWSRMDWLLARKDADLRALLLCMTEPVLYRPQQEAVLRTALGGTPEELDAQWKEFVQKGAPRK